MLAHMLGICAFWASRTARALNAGLTLTTEDTGVDTSPQGHVSGCHDAKDLRASETRPTSRDSPPRG